MLTLIRKPPEIRRCTLEVQKIFDKTAMRYILNLTILADVTNFVRQISAILKIGSVKRLAIIFFIKGLLQFNSFSIFYKPICISRLFNSTQIKVTPFRFCAAMHKIKASSVSISFIKIIKFQWKKGNDSRRFVLLWQF